MQIYPAGESITRRLLDLPQQQMEWIITGADANDVVAAGFHRLGADNTCFIHPESGDIYRLARRQYIDSASGRLQFRCDQSVSVEDELATRCLTIVAMASDGEDIIDPFGGQEDLAEGVLRHATPHYTLDAQNLLTTALWAARLKAWGFRVAHGTFGLMKKMAASGAPGRLPRSAYNDAVLQALASPRPSEFFRVLHRCNALAEISIDLAFLFEDCDERHQDGCRLPEIMQSLDRVAAETNNLSSVIKALYELLAGDAYSVFSDLGMSALLQNGGESGD